MASTEFPNEAALKARLQESVDFYWATRARQTADQEAKGEKDAGKRSAATGGKQMDQIEGLISDIVQLGGLAATEIFRRSKIELPGYFRAEKKWDLLVVSKGVLVCAIELKSLNGPSYGNNANNRIEEALGSSIDVWLAYREGRLGAEKPRPFLGYMLLLEDRPEVHSPVRVNQPHFRIDPEYKFKGKAQSRTPNAGASYSQRFQVSLRRLIAERQYDGVCLTLATDSAPSTVTCPAIDLDFRQFALSIYMNAKKFAHLLG